MSSASWTEEGFGYELYNKDNCGKIAEFLKKHVDKETCKNYEKLQAYEVNNPDDFEYEMYQILGETAEICIGEIINKETGYCGFRGYIACGDTEVYPHIGYPPGYQWYRKPDMFLTEEKVREILEKYAEELGITEKPDYFILEYYG